MRDIIRYSVHAYSTNDKSENRLIFENDPISDRIIAAGCQLIVFTTGRGNAIGSAVAPVMKVTANGDTARKLSDNIDLDMSAVLEEGVSLDAMAHITMQQILDTLSGRLTSAEALKLGYSEAVISRACEYC